ncbi:uncharacterized protein LOC129313386 isoform X2 [Prosopis cineraria]|uniref:uncharacterized protein LOC129313386 isoform X2 n=1 Tax=Prosopis cineraria TaxID=364024 RepID=UPI00240FEA97|nr:uncharacterized protein LOC129313386 isoform X2 [Prosopis cineraria]
MRRLTKAKIRILSKESLPKIASEDDEMVQLRFQETLIFRRMVLCSLVVAVLVGLWKLFFGTNCHFWKGISMIGEEGKRERYHCDGIGHSLIPLQTNINNHFLGIEEKEVSFGNITISNVILTIKQ